MAKRSPADRSKITAVDPEETDRMEVETKTPTPRRPRGPGRPFEKGTSGNRKGRPPRPSPEIDFRNILLREITRLVAMPGVRGKVPAIQAVVRGTIVSAVKGNSRSQHQVLQLYRDISREREVIRDVAAETARETGVSAKAILARMHQRGIEVPGNLSVMRDIALEIAREQVDYRMAELAEADPDTDDDSDAG